MDLSPMVTSALPLRPVSSSTFPLPRDLRMPKNATYHAFSTWRCLNSFHQVDHVTRDSSLEKFVNIEPRSIATIIMGGDRGESLFPLSMKRAKPAVPFGGCYRLIDIPLSNCITNGLNQIYILTQFNSQSLNRHIAKTYSSANSLCLDGGFIEVLAAMQTHGEYGKVWSEGKAGALRKFAWLLEDPKLNHVKNILILPGDHLHRMEYMDFIQKHEDSGADISVCCSLVDESRASNYGLFTFNERGRINNFYEKKGGNMERMMNDNIWGLSTLEAKKSPYIASMEIYLFKREILLELLREIYPNANHLGSEIISRAIQEHYDVQPYLFTGYWEDIGNIRSFFHANMALTDQPARFDFCFDSKPICTTPRSLPPMKCESCQISRSVISHGCILQKCKIEHSVVGLRSRIDYGVKLMDTVMMGADSYETDVEIEILLAQGKVPMGVGANTTIRNCIIDKNARIGKDVMIANLDGVQEADRALDGFYIRSGIVIVVKNATIKDGTII